MTEHNGPVCISVINMKARRQNDHRRFAGKIRVHAANMNVLAVDLDPQANLSQAFMREHYLELLGQKWPSIVELFRGHLPPRSRGSSPSSSNREYPPIDHHQSPTPLENHLYLSGLCGVADWARPADEDLGH